MVMVFNDNVVGTVLVSLFGFAFPFLLWSNNNRKKKDCGDQFKIQTNSVNGSDIVECSPEHGSIDDVIIVGAGVAGAALAHTLGKVNSFFFFSLLKSFFLGTKVHGVLFC